ncbi:MAG: hypothetical protein KGL21_02155, partial [Alphaproteobacteria bacterium]|nr:hypothetical protein [Alphaproteobacteria bacterium]
MRTQLRSTRLCEQDWGLAQMWSGWSTSTRPTSVSLIGLVLAGFAAPVFAQPAAPITVTPQTLAPEHRDNGFRVEIPET